MSPSGCTACPGNVIDLNSNIPAWAAKYTTAQSPIIVVDQWTGFNTATDTKDGVHPTDPVGITKIANKFYPAVIQAFGIAGLQPNFMTSSTSTTTKTKTSVANSTPLTTQTSTTTITVITTKTTSSNSCAVHWSQCGGTGFSSPSSCCGGYTCTYLNDWYSQSIYKS
ncbi:hypothetical protein HK096_009741 [Nowakowskiella sp. JEL0078]|nr:hypothetical protein HK096_009741 [Nowakowskiella sp. JEL0078]